MTKDADQFTRAARDLIAKECDQLGPNYHLRARLYLNGTNDDQPELQALAKLLRSITPRPLEDLLAEEATLKDAADIARNPGAHHPAPELAAALELMLPSSATGWIVTLETANFVFEAHGRTEFEANETMGRALTAHERQYDLTPDWWAEMDFQTHHFKPGTATRDGEPI